MKYIPEYICRICGYKDLDPFWLETGGPSYQICTCCGGQSGYHDCIKTAIIRKRKEWVDKGYNWQYEEVKPKDWNLKEQMENIPDIFQSDV